MLVSRFFSCCSYLDHNSNEGDSAVGENNVGENVRPKSPEVK